MKAAVLCFAVICVSVLFARAQDVTSVDCTKSPRHFPIHMCCTVPHVSTKEQMQQCAQFAGPSPPPPMKMSNNMPPPPGPHGRRKMRGHLHPHGPPPCFVECIFNQTGILGEDGELNEDKYKELLYSTVKDDEEMVSVLEESLDTCFEKATDLKAEIAEKMKEHPNKADFQSCSPFSAMIMGCINFETFQNCPTSAWYNSEECNASRRFALACKGSKSK